MQPILTEAGALTSKQRNSSERSDSQLVEAPIIFYLVVGMGELATRWLAEGTACIMTSGHCICCSILRAS